MEKQKSLGAIKLKEEPKFTFKKNKKGEHEFVLMVEGATTFPREYMTAGIVICGIADIFCELLKKKRG